MKSWKISVGLLFILALTVVACGGDDDNNANNGELTPVTLQLQWVTQSQFAGYYAAKELGYYESNAQ